ncbi:hypothetical protein GCM10023080_032560 [Streptomyces pseudoechinosporeus]
MRLWKDYVHRPERQLWHDYEWGNVHWYCCGNPLEARALLDTVMQALSPRSARELRQIISRFDAVWNQPSPPYGRSGCGRNQRAAEPHVPVGFLPAVARGRLVE